MKLTVVFLLFPLKTFAVWQTNGINKSSDAETWYNGLQIDIQFAPYMALVYADNSFPKLPFCGAAIITTRHLISTAYFFHIHRRCITRSNIITKWFNLSSLANIGGGVYFPYQVFSNKDQLSPQNTNKNYHTEEQLKVSGQYGGQNKNFKVVTGSDFAHPVHDENYKEVKKVYKHEKYDPSEIYHNIALIELRELLELSYKVNLIKLMTFDDLDNILGNTVEMKLTGYGQQNIRTTSHLVENSIIIQDTKLHRLDDRLLVLKKMSFNTCFGDSGNPGVINGKLAAMMIYEDSCDLNDLPKLFTGIVYYYEWIKLYVGQERLEKYPDLS